MRTLLLEIKVPDTVNLSDIAGTLVQACAEELMFEESAQIVAIGSGIEPEVCQWDTTEQVDGDVALVMVAA